MAPTHVKAKVRVDATVAEVEERYRDFADRAGLKVTPTVDGLRASGSDGRSWSEWTLMNGDTAKPAEVRIQGSSTGSTDDLIQVTQRLVDHLVDSVTSPIEPSESIHDRDDISQDRDDIAEMSLVLAPFKMSANAFAYPLGKQGGLIGAPGQGTHSWTSLPNNWQSDNAVDIKIPVGTPVLAVANGKIGSRIGPLSSTNPRMAGLRVYVETGKNDFYYAHLSKLVVQPGQTVHKGQVIGYTGSANGVAHLHFAQQKGDPRITVRRR